jgi:N6-adenosine-specific RNA methylase IME4
MKEENNTNVSGSYSYHELSTLFPLLETDKLNELADDIKSNGLQQPVVIYNNQILDGRNRFQACKIAGVTPSFTEYTGSNAISYVMSVNFHRRHLTATQKATVAVKLLPELEKQAKLRMQAELKQNKHRSDKIIGADNVLTGSRGESVVHASKIANVSKTYIQQASKIQEENPDLFKEMESGKKTIKEAHNEIKKVEHAKRVQIAKENPVCQNKGPFNLILADPPWRYDFSETTSRDIENQYPTATLEEIKSHSPNSSDNAILFLWATAPKLIEAIEIMKSWGFTYKTCAVWDKEVIGMGYWFRGQHELLLVGTKGNPGSPIDSERVSSVFREKRTKHSKKPECVYEWIEKTFPYCNKLEMYCRNARANWSLMGNEVGI